ncbi:uncharacterized protein LOC108833649 isoform X1 [Raphanus sativus]|uniref:Uncharacterized protein LOC108833649 isoform X1 n=1 Tax=Raphanus sativus TaxID=3726 RepID=A0A9W3C507_RAPSA|nr:uncharacterized protein LOC108833649 isoform X1 [Raphanus sativus]
MGLYAMHHNSRIPFESAKRVFDDEAMMTYPWVRIAYEVLVDSIKRLDPQGKSYFINGLTNVLLVWAYESVTCFGERFGRVVDEQEVSLFRWGGKRTRTSLDTVIAEEIREHGEVRVRKMVMKDSLEEMFPQWPDESDDTLLVNLITDIYTGRFVRDFWVTSMKRKQTKAGGSSKAEPPIKKQKKVNIIVEDEVAVEGKGAREKENTEDIGNKKILLTIMHSLEKISSKIDNYDNRFDIVDERFNKFEERLTRYESRDSNIADLVRTTVEEYLSKVLEQQSLSLPPPPPPPPPPQQSVTSSAKASPAKAFRTVAQASDVDFVTVSPSKDPTIGRGCRVKLKGKRR